MVLTNRVLMFFSIGCGLLPAAKAAFPPPSGGGLAAILSDAEAWKKLPRAERGGDQPLPSWARMMAGELPRTTAALLQLDFAQRTKSPVGPKLRAAMRWVAAHANRCAYSEDYNTKRPAQDTVTLKSDEEAWQRMPGTLSGATGTLPNWAKAVAAHLPRTAAAMIELVVGFSSAAVVACEQPSTVEPASVRRARAPLPESAEAWLFLPPAEQGAGQPLPVWARALARSLPRTTAAMLDLDRIHRTKSPLGPLLRGKVRWVAAHANRCVYSLAIADADLRRAGLDEAGFAALAGDHTRLPRAEKAALAFARTMTLSADEVTDAEVAELKSLFGEAKLTAMVQLLAYANFQDRLLLALDLPIDPGGPQAPPEIRFTKGAPAPPVPPRAKIEGRPTPVVPERIDDPEWLSLDLDALQRSLSSQRARPSRIRVPTWDEVSKVLPAGYPPPKSPVRIQWSLVCMGYSPELGAAWSACTTAFREEAKQDRVFEESLFWVVTRTIHCFY